jgi:hypothetical protein
LTSAGWIPIMQMSKVCENNIRFYPMFNFSLNNKRSPFGLRYSVRISARSYVRVDKAKGVSLFYGSAFLCPMKFASR